jgi:hypothetical protein
MNRVRALIAITALLSASAAQAARDPGLMLHDTHADSRRIGAGAQVSLTLPLGGAVRASERAEPQLSLSAGPSVVRSGSTIAVGARSTVVPLTELAVRPGHSTTWSLAGQPLAASYSTAALRERSDRGPDGERNNISTLGAVAIGVGVVVIVGAVLFVDAVRDANRNSD